MVPIVKGLPCKQEDLSLISGTNVKSWAQWLAEEAETGGSLGLSGQSGLPT